MIKPNLGQVKCLLDFVHCGYSKRKMPSASSALLPLHLIKLSHYSRTTISNKVSHNSFTLRRNFQEKLWVYKGVRSHHTKGLPLQWEKQAKPHEPLLTWRISGSKKVVLLFQPPMVHDYSHGPLILRERVCINSQAEQGTQEDVFMMLSIA